MVNLIIFVTDCEMISLQFCHNTAAPVLASLYTVHHSTVLYTLGQVVYSESDQ